MQGGSARDVPGQDATLDDNPRIDCARGPRGATPARWSAYVLEAIEGKQREQREKDPDSDHV